MCRPGALAPSIELWPPQSGTTLTYIPLPYKQVIVTINTTHRITFVLGKMAIVKKISLLRAVHAGGRHAALWASRGYFYTIRFRILIYLQF